MYINITKQNKNSTINKTPLLVNINLIINITITKTYQEIWPTTKYNKHTLV